ncbi:hypothetical protein RHOER0001_4614 [Rhodococcus erythropolis SK121]|nr:hypothetical protein RHOER0001_4614 [Rhodococcus erythropolis SK121]
MVSVKHTARECYAEDWTFHDPGDYLVNGVSAVFISRFLIRANDPRT